MTVDHSSYHGRANLKKKKKSLHRDNEGRPCTVLVSNETV